MMSRKGFYRGLVTATVLLVLCATLKNVWPPRTPGTRFDNKLKTVSVPTTTWPYRLVGNGNQDDIQINQDNSTYLNDNAKASLVKDIEGETHVSWFDMCSRKGDNDVAKIQQKVKHIMFLKVHKAGSTTMEYLFFRFGIHYNLTLVLPKNGVYVLMRDDLSDILPIRQDAHYDILASHTVYNSTKISHVLPEDTVKIGIIREPFDRMVSAAYYYRDVSKMPYLSAVPKDNFISNLIRNHSVYDTNEFSQTKNSMAMDFGFPKGLTENMSYAISAYISKLSSEFELILIMERFDESLILMKRLLKWDMSDILHVATNRNKHIQVTPDTEDLAKFKSMCFLDYAIYNHFWKIFESKIASEGKSFKEEVENFKTVLDSVNAFCRNVKEGDNFKVDGSQWNCPFTLTSRDCKAMEMDLDVISLPILRERHIKIQGL